MSDEGESVANPKRILLKTGVRNIKDRKIPRKFFRYLNDMINTLIETRWRFTLTLAVLAYFSSWTFFGMFWYLIAWAHGDLDFDPVTRERINAETCLVGADTFVGSFLLSVEAQVTTGYGERMPTEHCPEALALLTIQLIFGVLLDGAMLGMIYAKIIRPPIKTTGIKFSKYACICQRDGILCLIIRMVDLNQSHAIRSKVKAFLFEEKTTAEGENLGQIQRRLELVGNGKLFLFWPETICHIIDENSPFYTLSASDLLERKFEILITIFGDSRKTGQTIQARTSYLPSEVHWGHRFANIIEYDSWNGGYKVDYSRFDELQEVDTALCCAKRLKVFIESRRQSEVDRERLLKSESMEEDGSIKTASEDDVNAGNFAMNRQIARTTSATYPYLGIGGANFPAIDEESSSDSAKSLTYSEDQIEMKMLGRDDREDGKFKKHFFAE